MWFDVQSFEISSSDFLSNFLGSEECKSSRKSAQFIQNICVSCKYKIMNNTLHSKMKSFFNGWCAIYTSEINQKYYYVVLQHLLINWRLCEYVAVTFRHPSNFVIGENQMHSTECNTRRHTHITNARSLQWIQCQFHAFYCRVVHALAIYYCVCE